MRIGDGVPLGAVGGASAASGKPGVKGTSFSSVLGEVLGEVSELQGAADRAVEGLVTGEVRDVHTAVVAFEKAQLAFQLTMAVRNKLVESYQEIMRMQL